MDANHYTTNAPEGGLIENYQSIRMLERINMELQEAIENLNCIQLSVSQLQFKSNRVSSGLLNRHDVFVELNNVLSSLEISNELKEIICLQGVSENFQEAAIRLDELMTMAADMQTRGVQCASETLIEGGNLLRQVCSKADNYFVSKLYSLGREIDNLGVLQQAAFLRFSKLFNILDKYNSPKAGSFRRDYVLVTQNYYYTKYQDAVNQFGIKAAAIPLPATPLVGDIKQSNALMKFADKVMTAFSSTDSANILSNNNNSHSGLSMIEQAPSDLVSSFSAVAQVLIDFIKIESKFAQLFFRTRPVDMNSYLKDIFARPIASFHRRLQERLFLAANLTEVMQLYGRMIELHHHHHEESTAEGDQFLETVLKLYTEYLASRVKVLISNQVKSLDYTVKIHPPQTNILLTTRRFATLIVDTVTSTGGMIGLDDLKRLLEPLIQAVDKHISHTAAALMNARSQSIHMINNYDYLITFIENCRQRNLQSQVFLLELINDYDGKLNNTVNNFVVEELRPYFSLLFEFLVQQELGHQMEDNLVVRMGPIIEDFNSNVATRVRSINASVMQAFSDYRTAVFVINVMFSQLLTAYQQFLELHDSTVGKNVQQEGQASPMSITAVEQTLRQCHPAFDTNKTLRRRVKAPPTTTLL